MKKISLKRAVAISLAALLPIVLIFTVFASIALADSVPSAGRSFTALETVAQDKYYDSFPATVEAWVKYPSATEAPGAIFSTERGEVGDRAKYGITFGIAENAQPRIYIDNGDHKFDIKFASIPASNEWVHLTFVSDAEAGAFTCYVNGCEVGRDTTTMATAIATEVYTERPFVVGGSYERYNPNYFKGEIASVAVFSEIRSSDSVGWDFSVGVHESFGGTQNLVSRYDFSGDKTDKYTDLSGNGFDLTDKTFLDEDEYTPVTDFAYSFAIVGDTQRITELYPDSLDAIYQWIADNKDKEKIEVVLGMGDITEQSTVTQWQDAKEAVKILEDAGIPYQLTRGNHDMKTTNPADATRIGMNDVFGNYAGYMGQFEGCFTEGDATNTYFTKKIGEVDYLFLALDYGASDAMLAWADAVIVSHPDHKVIISTHGYEYPTGKKLGFAAGKGTPPAASNDYEFKKYTDNPNVRDYNHAVDMWDELISKHGNIMLVLSGHEGADDIIYHTDVGVHGNDVPSFLINPQGADDKYLGIGTVCLFKFSEDGKEIYIEYYSVMKEAYFRAVNQFTLTLSDDTYEAHNIERYYVYNDATCNENASKLGICVDCGHEEIIEIEGTAHGHAVGRYEPSESAGCENNATERGDCAICGYDIVREIPNSATGHDYEDGECKNCHTPENNE